eukprot:comp20856_c0_seq1/m.27600 comp20856_c0_seq1/g.27600  ORF comp20856_c0_seq1/g.27600 comp20856_c0_seq1/m.27600 type:complete len:193 (-) comp20856_c0_seq1:472-1050(-)
MRVPASMPKGKYVCSLCNGCKPTKRNNIEQHIWQMHPDRHGYDSTNVKYRAAEHKHLVQRFVLSYTPVYSPNFATMALPHPTGMITLPSHMLDHQKAPSSAGSSPTIPSPGSPEYTDSPPSMTMYYDSPEQKLMHMAHSAHSDPWHGYHLPAASQALPHYAAHYERELSVDPRPYTAVERPRTERVSLWRPF